MAAGGTEISKAGFDTQGGALRGHHAYYHRAGHWKEPPNFYNPFWRATLYKPDSGRRGGGAHRRGVLDRRRDDHAGLRGAGFKRGL